MAENNSALFIDIQGFNCSFGYVPKELAIYDGYRLSSFLFKPPFNKVLLSAEDQKVVTWSENYHGLSWEIGCVDLNDIDAILKRIYEIHKNPKIFVKGTEKALFLRKFFDDQFIQKIPVGREPKLSRFKKIPECFFHKSLETWHCAMENVKLLYNYKNCD